MIVESGQNRVCLPTPAQINSPAPVELAFATRRPCENPTCRCGRRGLIAAALRRAPDSFQSFAAPGRDRCLSAYLRAHNTPSPASPVRLLYRGREILCFDPSPTASGSILAVYCDLQGVAQRHLAVAYSAPDSNRPLRLDVCVQPPSWSPLEIDAQEAFWLEEGAPWQWHALPTPALLARQPGGWFLGGFLARHQRGRASRERSVE